MVEVKICGLTRRNDAAAAEAAGARYGGVILAPGSPRTLHADQVHEVFRGTGLARCGVFVNETVDRIADLAPRLGLSVVQLHGDETPEQVNELRERTEAMIWKAIRPRDAQEFVQAAERFGDLVDGLLLDGWSRGSRGGTGTRFPWREIAPYRGRLEASTALVTAGGLNPENVSEAISLLRPDIVDVSSGVESAPGTKDEQLIEKFAVAAGAAAARKGVT